MDTVHQPPSTDQVPAPISLSEPPLTPEVPSSPKKASGHKILYILAAVLALFILIFAGLVIYKHNHKKSSTVSQSSALNAPIQISITANGFEPKTAQISVGQGIVWTNYDTKTHTVASDPFPTDNIIPGFKSDPLATSQTFSFIFDKKGSYGYHDDMNPFTFKGTILIK